REARAPGGPPTTGRNRLDQYLPRLELADAVWRLQGVELRPRERHRRDGALHTDEFGLGRPPGDPRGLVRELSPVGSRGRTRRSTSPRLTSTSADSASTPVTPSRTARRRRRCLR